MSTKDILIEYAKMKESIKELEVKIKELQPQVFEIMGDNEELELQDIGTFVIGKRRQWSYPQVIKQAEEDLKTAKKEAERNGDAEYVENPYILFKGVKGE